MELLQGAVFALLLVLVMAWLTLVERLADRMALRHPQHHAALGLGAVRLRNPQTSDRSNNFSAVVALLRFLLGAESQQLDDPQVRRLVLAMRGVLAAFAALALVFTATVFHGTAPRVSARPGAAASGASSADRESAIRLERAGRLIEAVAQFDALLQGATRDADLMYRRALVHARLGHAEQALRDLAQVQDWEPTHFEAHLRADRILADQQRWDDILALWSRFLHTDPDHAQAHLERARVHMHEGHRQAALDDARRACELGRRDACRVVRRMQETP